MAKAEKQDAGPVNEAFVVPAPPDPEERIPFVIPLTGNPEVDDAPVFVQVNGKNARIKRGVTVYAKRKFVEVLQHSNEQSMEAYRNRRAAQKRGDQALMEL